MTITPYHVTLLLLSLLMLGGCSAGDENTDSAFVVQVPIAYVERSVPIDDNDELTFTDYREPAVFNAGAHLMLKSSATSGAKTINLTQHLFPDEAYDVKNLHSSVDGHKLLFSLRAPEIEDADDDEQPKWDIWEYDLVDEKLRRIISADLIAQSGQDINPAYLPDGRIVFSSTRQRGINAIRLDESKPQFPALDDRRQRQAFVLHVMDADGANIQQISYNISHDLYPAVQDNGRLVFSRYLNAGNQNVIHLYTINPDGTDVQLLYGNNSHSSGTGSSELQLLKPRPQLNGQLLVQATPFDLSHHGSNWFLIDSADYINIDQRIDEADPANPVPANINTQVPLFNTLIPSEDELAQSGRYLSIDEFSDASNRYLVTWNACRLQDLSDPQAQALICNNENIADSSLSEGPANAAIWIFDAEHQSQKPVYIPPLGFMVSEAVAIMEKTQARFIAPTTTDENSGTVHIRSLYDLDGIDTSSLGLINMRDPANYGVQSPRFLRIIKGVGIPDNDTFDFDNSAFGPVGPGMRQILGYVPVEPDGSVMVTVPANMPFMISMLDQQGRRIHRTKHNSWLQVRNGETLHCHGCHERNSENPHGRNNAMASAVNTGADAAIHWPNTHTSLTAGVGETMAQTYSRIHGVRKLSADLTYQDDWSENSTAPMIDIQFTHEDPLLSLDTLIPTSTDCQQNWGLGCRININYPEHIQPLWDKPRSDGVRDLQCTLCHSRQDADNNTQLPAGIYQLELTSQASDIDAGQMTSYRELLSPDDEQEISGGVIININIDPDPNIPQAFPAILNRNGAAFSSLFFDRFNTDSGDTIHAGLLKPIERKLIAEWLDIGAQYYNNPFEAPEN